MEHVNAQKPTMGNHLARIHEGLREMSALADPLGMMQGSEAFRHIAASLMEELETAKSLLKSPDADPHIPCPACGGSVMPKATLCGYCWKRLPELLTPLEASAQSSANRW